MTSSFLLALPLPLLYGRLILGQVVLLLRNLPFREDKSRAGMGSGLPVQLSHRQVDECYRQLGVSAALLSRGGHCVLGHHSMTQLFPAAP